jgi:hypothetical protein
MAFKPACLSLFSIRAQTPRAKLPSIQKAQVKLKKEPNVAGEFMKI